MPYLAHSLMASNSPRMRCALRDLLYGDGTTLDVERLKSLVGCFG